MASYKVFPNFGQNPQILDKFTNYVHISSSVPKKPPWFTLGNNSYIYFKAQQVLISIKVFHNCFRIPYSLEYLTSSMPNFSLAPRKPPCFILGLIIYTYYNYNRTRPGDKVLNKFCNFPKSLGNYSIHLPQPSSAEFRPRWQVRISNCKTITTVCKGTTCSIHTITIYYF